MGQEVFKQMLREKGLKVTAQRMLVLEIMAAHPGEHLTAEEIFDLARQAYPEIGLATIYRTLLVLVELQIIDKISLDDGCARYELGRKPGSDEHHHHHDHEDHEHDHGHHHHYDDDDHDHEDHDHHHHHGPHCTCGCHAHDHHHHHHHSDADETFQSWGKESPKPFSRPDLERILEVLDSGEYGQVLRAKGIVPDGEGGWLEFDFVPGEKELRPGKADYTGRICVIGSGLKLDKLPELFGL